jgi:hypothetical protein
MPNQKRKKEVVDNSSIKKSDKFKILKPLKSLFNKKKDDIDSPTLPPVIVPKPLLDEEKVEVLIKESIMINPRDFSAFKHALEDFVKSWNK